MSTERRSRNMTVIAGRMPLPSFTAWFAANSSRFKPGSINQVLIIHDHGCRYPWGEPCTCLPGPEIKVAGEDPETN